MQSPEQSPNREGQERASSRNQILVQIFGLRTDVRIVQRADEAINLMILESLSERSPTIEQLVHTIRYAERP